MKTGTRVTIFALVTALRCFGALPALTTTWEIHPTSGVDTNGGCFIAGSSGSDLSYPTSSPVAYTDLVAVTATTITSAATPFSAASVGNCLHIASGTGWTPGWYYVVSVTVVTATVDRAIATIASTGGTGTLGGALKTISQFHTNGAAGNIAWMKAEATVTTATGFAVFFAGTNGTPTQLYGYGSTRGDLGKVTIQATAANITLIGIGTNSFIVKNFTLDVNSQANVKGFHHNAQFGEAVDITVLNVGNASQGFNWGNSQNTCLRCLVNGGSGTGMAFNFGSNGGAYCWFCIATGMTAVPFEASNSYVCSFCIAANNTGATTDGFSVQSGGPIWIMNSIACGNGRDGINASAANFGQGSSPIFMNNILTGNGRYGFNFSGFSPPAGSFIEDYDAYFNNTTADRNGFTGGGHDITMTGTPFNCAGNDFSLNNTAGAGARIRSAGYAGALPLGSTGFMDIGVLQASPASAVSTVGFGVQ
jgi:hypothetical protein